MLVSNNLILSEKGKHLLRFLDSDAEISPQTEGEGKNIKTKIYSEWKTDFYPKTQKGKFKEPKKKNVKYKDMSHFQRNKK